MPPDYFGTLFQRLDLELFVSPAVEASSRNRTVAQLRFTICHGGVGDHCAYTQILFKAITHQGRQAQLQSEL